MKTSKNEKVKGKKGVVLALLFSLFFALNSSAQIRIWQLGSQDTLNVNSPAGTMIEADGSGSFRFVSKADIATEGRIDTVVITGKGEDANFVICYPDACDTISLYQLFDTTLVDTSNFATWQALEDTTAMILSLIPDVSGFLTEENQSLSYTKNGEIVAINITEGSGTSFSVADNDNDPTNELPDSTKVTSGGIVFYYPTRNDTVSLNAVLSQAIDSMLIKPNGYLCIYADSTIVDSVLIEVTADRVNVADTANYFAQSTVENILKELYETILAGGDGWGADTVVHDATLIGKGIEGDSLSVDKTGDWTGTFDGQEGAYYLDNTDDQTATIDSTGSRVFTITLENGNSVSWKDSVGTSGSGLTSVEYDNLETDLTGNTTNNTVTWDIDGSGIITCSLSSSGTIVFSNPKVNKYLCVVLTLSSGATLTWPASAKILDGSATLGDGTFYVYIHCISSSLYIVSITKEAS